MSNSTPSMPLSDLSAYTGTPQSSLRAMIRRGDGPPTYKIGRNLRFRPSEVEQWLTGLRAEPRPARAAHIRAVTNLDQTRVAGGVPAGGQYAPTDRPDSDVQLTLPRDEHGSIVQGGGVDVVSHDDGRIELLGWATGEGDAATTVTPLTRDQARNLIDELSAALGGEL